MLRRLFEFTAIGTILMGAAHADLQQNQDYLNGMEALNAGLPEAAVQRLKIAAEAPNLSEEERVELLLNLCEAQVRSRMGKEAELTIQNPLLADHPDKAFWLAHSYVAQGRRKDAAAELEVLLVKPEYPRRQQVIVHLAELYRSIQQSDKAFSLLEKAQQDNQLDIHGKIQLAETYLQSKQIVKVRSLLDSLPEEQASQLPSIVYLSAQLELAEGKFAAAERKFSQIITNENAQASYKEISTLGLSDAMAQSGDYVKAFSILIDLADKDGDSVFIGPVFNRLIKWQSKLENTDELEQLLNKWIKRPEPVPAASGDVEIELNDRDAFAHYLYALMLGQRDNEASLVQSQTLLDLLRTGQPNHSLVSKSWFLTSENKLKQGDVEGAKLVLEDLAEQARTDFVKQKAKVLIGMIQADSGDIEQSLKTFQNVAQEQNAYSDIARANAAIMELQRGNLIAFQDATKKVSDPTIRNGLLYEEAMAAVIGKNQGAEQSLLNIVETIEHPLQSEARLLIIRESLAKGSVESEQIEQQIKVLKSQSLSSDQQEWLAKMELRFLIETKQWERIVQLYEQLKQNGHLSGAKLAVLIGEAYYRNGEYNKARREFNTVIQDHPDSPYLEYAYFYSGLAARREGTPQSKEEAATLLQSVIKLDGSFKVEAVVQKSRILIDLKEFDLALVDLTGMMGKVEEASAKAQLNLLLGEVNYQKGIQAEEQIDLFKKSEKHFLQTLEYYKGDPVWSNRIHFWLGQTREQIDTTFASALSTYFIVVNLENTPNEDSPKEWEWYYKSGLRAVELLEKLERWKAAANLLEKMSAMYGPKSDVLAERAAKIRLKNHIW